MENTIPTELVTRNLFNVLDEVFEKHQGIFLDPNTSLFDTLKTVSAAEASQPVGGKCATLAAQVAHTTFYIELNERYMVSGHFEDADWGEIWRTVSAVTANEWETLQQKLEGAYRRVMARLNSHQDWADKKTLDGTLAIIVHTAYHLGEIRQALCTLKSG